MAHVSRSRWRHNVLSEPHEAAPPCRLAAGVDLGVTRQGQSHERESWIIAGYFFTAQALRPARTAPRSLATIQHP